LSTKAVNPLVQVSEKDGSVLEQVIAAGSVQLRQTPLLSTFPLKQERQSAAAFPLQVAQEGSHLMMFPLTEEYPSKTVRQTLVPLIVMPQMLQPGSQVKTPPEAVSPPLKPLQSDRQEPLE
jgi:hypothetical protein